ncbi:hypothetical protein Afil01_53420 [Actinorhabdospora filicis]|uniref:Uncharacterized protein n=1 Tax=Actinorhabdospora filicis TaxID=1785913 RepID=A0A9W6SRA5_9ACTN|nr:hypothetical protein [Actinorhabdospora filicis]GLZ80535.1 hypothetical protein Afil01_53420 [Actinorhabdospora filicis]
MTDQPRPVFPRVWAATDLEDHRPASMFATYSGWDYDTLPPLDPARLKGFAWAGEAAGSAPDPEQVEFLAEIAGSLPECMVLPDAFVHFATRPELYEQLDEVSTTSCYIDISAPVPSPVEKDAVVIRFFRDQQDCLFWYLYLRPDGTSFIAESEWSDEWADHDDEEDEDDEPETDDGGGEEEGGEVRFSWTGPSIEEFAYRYWLECKAWYVVSKYFGGELTDEIAAYLAHYKKPAEAGD